MRFLTVLFVLGLVALGSTASVPTFPDQYTAHGVILLPYAEIKEPFAAYYDGVLNRSRIDYYGDLMITIQKSGAAEKSSDSEYGNEYKVAWEADLNGNAKRVCFKASGSEHNHVTGQTVLPNLDGFIRIGTIRCPVDNINEFVEGSLKTKVKTFNNPRFTKVNHPSTCELWRRKDIVGEKSSTYSFWFKYDVKTGEPIPVSYEMAGYNNLLGSHYDHYIIHYTNFRDGLLNEELFNINEKYQCTGYPGPGIEKGHIKLTMNPFRSYFDNERSIYNEHFDQYNKHHNRKYDTEFEKEHRRKIFLDNSRYIISTNRRNPSYRLSINHLADKSEDELEILRGRKSLHRSNSSNLLMGQKFFSTIKDSELPESWDWRIYGAVGPVKDQAICGSCWSFGSTGTLEGQYFVKTGHLVRLSEQQLIDCSWQFLNNGCDGGTDVFSYNYIMKAGGIATESDYGHYLGVDGKCHAKDVQKSVKISGFVNVTQYSVNDLKKALVENGPISVAINASPKTLTFYSNGVLDDPKCKGDEDSLNHAVLLVGYGKIRGKEYWLIKNSWSTYYGNDGYLLIAVENNTCGVTTSPTYPLIQV